MTRASISLVCGAIVMASCGGGADEADPITTDVGATEAPAATAVAEQIPESDGTATVNSDDGRATLEYDPATADDPTAEVTLTASVSELLPEENAAAIGYELQPSGLRFSEPATLTIDLLPDESAAVGDDPHVASVVVDDSGMAAYVQASIDVVGSQTTIVLDIPHFSFTYVSIDGGRLEPARQEVGVGERFDVELRSALSRAIGVSTTFPNPGPVSPVHETLTDEDHGTATLTCRESTDGEHVQVRLSHSVQEFRGFDDLDHPWEKFAAQMVGPDDIADGRWLDKEARMTGEVRCLGSDEAPGTGSDGDSDSDSLDDPASADGQTRCELVYDTFTPKDPGGIRIGAALIQLGFEVTPDTGDELYDALGTAFPPQDEPLCWEDLKTLVDANEITPELAAALAVLLPAG